MLTATYPASLAAPPGRDLMARLLRGMGRVGSCFENAAAEAFFSTLEHEVLSRHHFTTRDQGRKIIAARCQDFYNTRLRHSSAGLPAPDYYEKTTAEQLAAA
jgi:putative transposase